ncbi:MAG TPA: hypothetical protein VM680_08530, partial [Verrucomicrobiae bacterium]|nr:hypothetical protein [Verrucomicrobiae bacterium]
MNTQGKWFVSGLLFSAAITLAAPGDPDPAINPLLDRSNVKVVAQSGSRLAISGSFTTVNNIPRAGVARLNADGSVDPTFAPAPSPDGVAGIYPLSNDKLLLAGSFTNVSSISRVALARLNSDGPVDPAFEVNWLAGGLRPGGPPPIPGAPLFGCSIHAVLRDGSLIALANNLWLPNGSEVPRLVKISTTGQIDATFTMPFNVPFVQTTAIWPLANGKLLALYGGYNDSGRLVRCNANGSLDSSFPEISTPRFLYQVVEQSDGKILLFGDFANQSVSRIHPDGALDTSFHPAVSGEVRAGAVQADGKIGIVGAFQLHGSTNTYTVARLNADGSLDVGFHALTGGLYEVSGVTIDSDGRIVSFGGGRVNNRRYEDGVR